ncbi:MAG: hypothetical protein ACK5RL_04005 [Acidimicrobiales bacterium]
MTDPDDLNGAAPDHLDDLDEIDDYDGVDDYDLDDDLPNPYAIPEVDALLEEAIEILAEARPLPMSTTIKVNRDELVHLLEQAQEQLPEEIRAARWLLKEREEFIAKAREEHQALIDEGRAQVARMVERQHVVQEAEAQAREILEDARAEANRLTRQVEEYCDRKLARFEAVLERTIETVQRGRRKLIGTPPVPLDDRNWDDDPDRADASIDLNQDLDGWTEREPDRVR